MTALQLPIQTAGRPPIMSRALALRFISIVASSIGFFLPLSALPIHAEQQVAGAGGITNGALLVACVAGELISPWLMARAGVRRTLAVGLVLLGAPLLVLFSAPTLPVMTAVAVVRGVGFALAVVAGGALTAALLPAERRGEGLAVVGLVAGIPAMIALPLGVWVAQEWGFAAILVAGAAVPLLGALTVPLLPAQGAGGEEPGGVLRGLRSGALLRPTLIFAASAAAAGAVVTYLPLAIGAVDGWLAPVALLIQSASSTAGRWVSGRIGDRYGTLRLLVPGILFTSLGLAGLVVTPLAPVVLVGAALFGTGFGILQNATLTLMYARSTTGDYGVVSAIWNAAYDGGMAVGALAVGFAGTLTGLGPAFLILAVVVAGSLAGARADRRRTA
jgi:predicted MFS family arabinose efflux permease